MPKRVMELETGYNRDTIDKLLQRFVEYGKIEYHEETKEILLKNWIKHNSSKSPKVVSCIKTELSRVKHKEFIRAFATLFDIILFFIIRIYFSTNHLYLI